MDITDEIKSRLDIVSFINNYVPLKKSGRNYKALCPFHAEKTPSFVVFPESQQWRCFGACGEGGDIFSFVMKREGWDFSDALRYLADLAGVELQPTTPRQLEAREQAERWLSMLAETARFFHRQLLEASSAQYAREYISARGISDQTIADFELGYAPDSWDATANMLLGLGYNQEDLSAGGLLVERDDGRSYDRFRDRLMIPIRDVRGRVVGFGARGLAPDATPKYLNSPQSDLFDKSRLLFGLDRARRTIRETETAVIVEGYMDVLQAHQAGFTNVVAEMGTALTEQQLKLVARYASQLILALDPDTAGQMATDRGREVIERVSKAAAEQVGEDGVWDLDTAEKEYRARLTAEFDIHGMLHYESRLGFDIRVITLPQGQDPDDVIRENPEIWAWLVEQALPIVEYAIQKAIEGQNLDDPKTKAGIADHIVPLINNVANPVERSHYMQQVARQLKVSERALFPESGRSALSSSRASRQPARQPHPMPDQGASSRYGVHPSYSREAFFISALLKHPRLIYQVNRILAEYLSFSPPDSVNEELQLSYSGLDALASQVSPGDFAHPAHRSIFVAWTDAISQDDQDPVEYLWQTLDPESSILVKQWFNEPLGGILQGAKLPPQDVSEQKVFEESVHALLTLRENRLASLTQDITYLVQDAGDSGDNITLQAYHALLRCILTARQDILQALKQYGPANKAARLKNGRRYGKLH
nr:DNA primase [Anaerolineae bacterium]